MTLSETVGKRVRNYWRDDTAVHGTVMSIELGVNGGARVLWDNRDYEVSMCLLDLALVDTYPGHGSRLSDMNKEN